MVLNSVENIATRIFLKTKNPWLFYLTIQDIFVYFLIKLQEAIEFIKRSIVVSSVFDKLRNEQHLFDFSEVDKIKRPNFLHQRLLRGLAQIIAFHYTVFSRVTVLDTVTIPQTKLYSLFLWKLSWFNYQLIWNALDRNCFKKFSNHFTEQELLPFLIKTENSHSKPKI